MTSMQKNRESNFRIKCASAGLRVWLNIYTDSYGRGGRGLLIQGVVTILKERASHPGYFVDYSRHIRVSLVVKKGMTSLHPGLFVQQKGVAHTRVVLWSLFWMHTKQSL